MKWISTKQEKFVNIECINPKKSKYILRVCPNGKNVLQQDGIESDLRYIPIKVNNKPTLQQIKNVLLSLIREYDSSDEVNSFILNGKKVWLDKSTRVGLMNSLTIEKESGAESSTLWFSGHQINIKCEAAIQMLSSLELYALKCYNRTAQHMKNIEQLSSIEEALNYDFTSNYPDKLTLTIESS